MDGDMQKATYMWLRWRDMEMAKRCGETEFSLYGKDGVAMVEGVENFNYLGRPLDQID